MKNPKLPDQSSPGGDAETVKNMIQLIDLRIDKIEKEWNHANRQYFKCAELDNEMEEIGSEDEENNFYSIGGDNHNDLEEDNGQ